jgi:hypothetical protein
VRGPELDPRSRHGGAIANEALVVVRIANSGPGLAGHAVAVAGNKADPTKRIAMELEYYGSLKKTYKGRIGVMQRPIVILKQLDTQNG